LISEGGWDRPSERRRTKGGRSQWFARGKREEGFLASWGPRDEKERARKTKAKKKGVWGGEIM
jgi:hypothetical protein